MQIDAYRVLSEVVAVGVHKAWRKTLGKHAFSGNGEVFGELFLARLPGTVMKQVLGYFPLTHPYLNVRKLMLRCVMDGASAGWRRAFEHSDDPSEDLVKDRVFDGIMLEITEYYSFPDASEEA